MRSSCCVDFHRYMAVFGAWQHAHKTLRALTITVALVR